MLLLLLSCSGNPPPGVVEEPVYSGDWVAPQRSDLEDLSLPPGPDGEDYLLIEADDAYAVVDLDNRSPVSAAAECGALVLECLAPERNVLGCLQNVPVCETDQPWVGDDAMCCPSECEARYVEQRQAGLEEADALIEALYGLDQGCFPSLVDYLEQGR